MDAGAPKKVPYRWFLRLTEPANPPPHDKAKEDEAREQKVAPQQAAHSKGQACQKGVSALIRGGSLALLLPLRRVESGSR